MPALWGGLFQARCIHVEPWGGPFPDQKSEWKWGGDPWEGMKTDRKLWLPEAFPPRHFNSQPFKGLRHQSNSSALGFCCQNFPPRHPSRLSTQPSEGLLDTPSRFTAANACWRLPKPLAPASTSGCLNPRREINSFLGERERMKTHKYPDNSDENGRNYSFFQFPQMTNLGAVSKFWSSFLQGDWHFRYCSFLFMVKDINERAHTYNNMMYMNPLCLTLSACLSHACSYCRREKSQLNN